MHGPDFPRPSMKTIQPLSRASSATITSIFRHKGIHNIWMPLKPLVHGMRTFGPALTIRSVPGREISSRSPMNPGRSSRAIPTRPSRPSNPAMSSCWMGAAPPTRGCSEIS